MPWITTEEAAEILDYNVEYVRRLIRNGRLNAQKSRNIWLLDGDAVSGLRRILDQQEKEGMSLHHPRRGSE